MCILDSSLGNEPGYWSESCGLKYRKGQTCSAESLEANIIAFLAFIPQYILAV